MEQKLLRKILLLAVIFAVLAGCASAPKSLTFDFTGVWKMQEAYTNDYTTPNNYLVPRPKSFDTFSGDLTSYAI